MSVVTVADYREIVGDESASTAEIQKRLDRAEKRVEDYLLRPLALGTYTESLRASCSSSLLHPTATPIISVSSPASAVSTDGVSISADSSWVWDMIVEHSWSSFFSTRHTVTVTYVGGWDNTTLPQTLKEAICALAMQMNPLNAAPMATTVPVGAMNVTLGDASIGFAKPFGSQGSIETLVPGISATLRQWRYRY